MNTKELNERIADIRILFDTIYTGGRFNVNELKRLDETDFYLFWYVDKHIAGFKRNATMNKVREKLCNMFDFDSQVYSSYSVDFDLTDKLDLFKMEAAIPYKTFGAPCQLDIAVKSSYCKGKKYVLLNLAEEPKFETATIRHTICLDSVISVNPSGQSLFVSTLKQYVFDTCTQMSGMEMEPDALKAISKTLQPKDLINLTEVLLQDNDIDAPSFVKLRTIMETIAGKDKVRNLISAWQLTNDTGSLVSSLYSKKDVLYVPQSEMPDLF